MMAQGIRSPSSLNAAPVTISATQLATKRGIQEFEFLVLVVDDPEQEHPAQLRKPLRFAIDANVLAHDVLDGFDRAAAGHAAYR